MPLSDTAADLAVGVEDAVWLGIDLGTQGVRASALDAGGVIVGRGSRELRSGHRSGRRHEQDPQEWWAALCAATRAATADLRGRRVGAVAVDSTSGTLVVQDSATRACSAGIMYDDGRATGEAAQVQDAGEELWEALGYRMQASWALPKAVWLVRHDAVRPGEQIVHQADHMVARLAGRPVPTDSSHALKTGLDLRTLRWPTEVLERLGLDPALLPAVVLPGVPLAEVSPAAAADTGIPAGTPVRAGMTDGCAAQIAVGALSPGSWTTALGTTLVVKGSTPRLLHDADGAVYCHRNPDGGWLPGGASSTGAGIVARDFAGMDLDDLTRRAAEHEPATGVTYPLTGTGERFPFVAGDAHGLADGVPDDPAQRFAGVLQGVAFLERLSYDVLGGLGADITGPVTFSGGATRNAYWNQLRADVLGRPVLLAGSAQASVGMAVLAAAPPGELGRTADALVGVVRRLEPDPARGARLHDAYRSFVDTLVGHGWLDPESLAVPAGTLDGGGRP